MILNGDKPNTWRDYQARFKRSAKTKAILKRVPLLGLYAGSSFLILLIFFFTGSWIFAHLGELDYKGVKKRKKEDVTPERLIKAQLPSLLSNMKLDSSLVKGEYIISNGGTKLKVETSLDMDLQNYIINLLQRSLTFQAAVVVLRSDNGQILAMADYEDHSSKERENICLKADFPAASLFKIVVAAAAIEAKGFTPKKPLTYKGGKYTLYKSQLKRHDSGRYTRKTSFEKAFSRSINPVFGKIGIYDLGKKLMTEYADRFLFNQTIPFDLPLGMSSIEVPDDEFGLAEIASGFNKRTLISPLHAVLITSAVANKGKIMEPWLIRMISDESGKIIYRAKPSRLTRPIEDKTAKNLMILMEDTVRYGTCHKAFRSMRRKKVFKNIRMGAKSGTINDPFDQYKYDWLTAYALPNNGQEGICIAVLAIHGKKLGIRAKDLAKYIIDHHYTS